MSILKRKKIKVDLGTVTIQLPEHIIAAAIEMQIAKMLEADDVFQAWLREQVVKEIELVGPMHPNMAAVVESVREHLDRYPLIGHDPAFQDYVGQKIFEWLQKPAR